ncbi:MAG: HEPN domain-containing protein [Cuspidothrix sp.]
MRYISNKKLWDEIAIKISGNVKQANQIKQQLILIVDRRNKIAHQADIDPTLGLGNRWNIDELMVSDAVNFIEQVVENIHQIL